MYVITILVVSFFIKMNKKYVLKKNHEINKLLKKKNSVGSYYYAIHYTVSSLNKARLAISISKKLGNAVVRNHEKRIIREIARNNSIIECNIDMLIVEKEKALDLSYLEKEKELNYLFKKIKKI